MTKKKHQAEALKSLQVAILSVSSTRDILDDKSGHWIKKRVEKEKHHVVYHDVVSDDEPLISNTVKRVLEVYRPHVLLVTGGTGVSAKDVTIEAVQPLFQKELTAFGALFSFLSYEEIGSAAMLSRATAGVIGKTVVFCMPGSLGACKLACLELILPELGHILKHVLIN